jgi:valyl-tRNA synthetase
VRRRNNLAMINILNLDGTLNAEAGPFAGSTASSRARP